jgi:predicted permease
MFGAPVAVSSYAMASEMGGDGALASNIMIITTFFSAITLSLGIYVMRVLGWI